MIKTEKVIMDLILLRDGMAEDGYSGNALVLNNAIQTIRELQEQLPKWHLVADGDLPKAEKSVLVVAKHIGYKGKVYYNAFRGIYEDGTIHSEDSMWNWDSDYTDALTYCEETDDFIIGKGWYEESLYNPENMSYEIDEDDEVIAWMELPNFESEVE